MLIGRVIGEIVSTQKHPVHEGLKILLVQPLTPEGADYGDAVVAVDSVEAGIGDRVLLATEGYSAMTSVGKGPQAPLDMAIIGVVDRIDLLSDAQS